MRERPILMSAPMVRAILAGTKTQTRRRVAFPRKRDSFVLQDDGNGWWPYQSDDGESSVCNDGCEHPYACPYGVPGDRLWVRETFRVRLGTHVVDYRADPIGGESLKWRPSIFMPRWACRITLEITDVRVERLQEISEADCVAEGIETTQRPYGIGYRDYRGAHGAWFTESRTSYQSLWESINGAGSWDANPWVWALTFRRIGDAKS